MRLCIFIIKYSHNYIIIYTIVYIHINMQVSTLAFNFLTNKPVLVGTMAATQ